MVVKEKYAQIAEVLKEKNIGLWLLMGRETVDICDPGLRLVLPTNIMGVSAFFFTPDGKKRALVRRQDVSGVEANGVFDSVVGYGSETVTRAEAAVVFNALLGLEGERECYLPDIEPGYWCERDVKLAARGSREKLGEGFVNLQGYLYSIDQNGYALKNGFIGSLRFDQNGRYTSGNYELDDMVAKVLVENVDFSADREEMLRTMYDYTRDHYTYLRRNYYQTSDIGWCLKEAYTMYSTGKGNCYCYASAFWAAARQLGFDALCVSGTIGSEHSPHGWVTISMDGDHYVFDVEIEMAYHRDGMEYVDNFKMQHEQAVIRWLYVELYKYDQILPMERQYGFTQQ